MNTKSHGPHGGHPDESELHELLDGDLPAGREERVMRHLAECEACGAAYRDLEALREQARGLVPERPPARDLWPEIEARIRAGARPVDQSAGAGPEASGIRDRVSPRRGPREHRIGRPRGWPLGMGSGAGLAAAAGIAAVVAGALLFMGPGQAPNGGTAGPAGPSSALLASEVHEVEQAYRPAIDELRVLADARELSPETRAVLEENLALIERAIEESREAVLADPEGHRALESLRRMYDAKVEVLRSVAVRY